MRHAPPVCVTGVEARGWRLLQAVLAGAAGAALAAWAAASGEWSPGLGWIAVGGSAAASALPMWAAQSPKPFTLQWDGAAWSLDGQPVALALAIDLDRWLLLRLRRAKGGVRWLPLGQAQVGAPWHALRVALHATPDASLA